MKTIFRNFYTTLRCYKMASTLNIIGLSVAFATLIVLSIQVRNEVNFDKSYPDAERIYRVERSWDSISYSPIMPRPAIDLLINGAPQIEWGALNNPFGGLGAYLSYEKNGTRIGTKEPINSVYPNNAKVFGMEIIEGDPNALEDYKKVIIPASLAKKLFDNESSIGKLLIIEDELAADSTKISFEVGGVYRDFPENSSQKNVIYTRLPANENIDNWGNSNYYAYVKLLPGASVSETENLLTAAYNNAERPAWASGNTQIRLLLLSELYYNHGEEFDVLPKGNRTTTMTLLAIAILIVVIAGINFVNFATSLTPIRIKSINTQKVLGSSVATLRAALIFEAVGISLLAWLLSLGWVQLLADLNFSEYLLTTISVTSNVDVIIMSLCVALATGILAGIYPAIYTTSFPPALVLKGSFGMSPKGRQLRTGLIGFQFVISLTLIIAALFLQLQDSYMRKFDNGFQQEQIAILNMGGLLPTKEKKTVFNNELKSNPLISDVAYAMSPIGSSDNYMTWGRNKMGSEESVNFTSMPVSWNFAQLVGLTLTEGRHFVESDQQSATGTFLFNQTAQRQYNLTIDDKIQGANNQPAPIAGILKDFNFKSLRLAIEPLALYEFGTDGWFEPNTAYIKMSGDPFAAVNHIKQVIHRLDPNYPIEITFYDEIFNRLYKKERKTTAMITSFSILAVIISLMGVFGIVLFETQFRRKEIGIRKVYGSTVGEILVMLNRKFVIIVAVCFVIAAPLAFVGVRSWLSSFVYRTPLSWWVFAAALFIVMLITLLTVNIQSYRAATENPVKSIKSE